MISWIWIVFYKIEFVLGMCFGMNGFKMIVMVDFLEGCMVGDGIIVVFFKFGVFVGD